MTYKDPNRTYKQLMTEFLDSLSKEDWDFIKTSFSFQSDREAMKYSLIHSIEQRIIREEVFNGT